jgi:glyceraldehyde 3-phosphate dehydrogenase
MRHRVGMNGFGRIGRGYVRCVAERGRLGAGVEPVADNDLWDADRLVDLTLAFAERG